MRVIKKCAYWSRAFNVLPALVVTPGIFATVDMEAGGAAIGTIPLGVVQKRRAVTLAVKFWWWHAGVAIAYGAVTRGSLFDAEKLRHDFAQCWRGAK